jgi:S-formylglutathione hydrolase
MSKPNVVLASLETDLVPSPMQYAVMLPPGYLEAGAPYPILMILHGGRGSREVSLRWYQDILEDMWAKGDLSPIVVVMPSATHGCRYMDYRDGSQRWETFLTGPFLEHVRGRFNVRRDREGLLVMGTSMGGIGSQRLAFKHPEVFGAVAGLEGAGPPVFEYDEIQPTHEYNRDEGFFEGLFGKPIDKKYWAENHPATVARDNAQRIIDSGLKVLIEVGDEDMVNLHHGTEFLHRVLWDHGIRHEYRVVRGANHVGRSMAPRRRYALSFLERCLHSEGPDPAVEESWTRFGAAYRESVGREGSMRGDWPYPLPSGRGK